MLLAAPGSAAALATAHRELSRREESLLDQRAALERFLADVERRAFRIAELSVRDREAALDIVQDAMIRLARRYADRPAEEWRPLFFRILANRITDHQRRGTLQKRLFAWLAPDRDDEDAVDPMAEIADPAPSGPEPTVEREAAMTALARALDRLPARQKQAFLLRELEGLDVAATAAAMNCSEGSVKTHYFRAVRHLRTLLGDHWP
jgi:RNA polymerase sigma-70 factor (ECF subfamily)